MLELGLFGALLIGIVLGLIGGGGSILTVPVFVYVLGVNPVLATAYSLFVVGSSALVGAVRNAQKNLVDFRTGIIFAIPAFIGVYLARKYILNIIPDELFYINDFLLTKDVSIMLFFALLMLLAAFFMIRGQIEDHNESEVRYNIPILIIEGLVVGILTGLVGAGGGFLIIPALVLFARLPMKKAVATSLMIIAIKSLFGFIGDIQNQNFEIDWSLLLLFTLISIAGIFIGLYLNNFIDGKKLKKGFGWFILIMSVYIFIKEII
jgi:hypothetical protein